MAELFSTLLHHGLQDGHIKATYHELCGCVQMRSWTGNWIFIIIYALLYRLKISSLCTNLMMWDELQQKREMSAFKGTHFVTQRKTTKRITRTTLCSPLPPQEGKKKKSSTLTKHEVKKAHFRQEGFFTAQFCTLAGVMRTRVIHRGVTWRAVLLMTNTVPHAERPKLYLNRNTFVSMSFLLRKSGKRSCS